jgi:hypothetical protein
VANLKALCHFLSRHKISTGHFSRASRKVCQRRRRDIFVEPKHKNQQSSVRSGITGITPAMSLLTELYSLALPNYKDASPTGFEKLTNDIRCDFAILYLPSAIFVLINSRTYTASIPAERMAAMPRSVSS